MAVNAYIIHNLDNWPKILLRKFTWKNCLFSTTNIVKNINKDAYDGKVKYKFGNDFAKNGVIFGIDINSRYHTDYSWNIFLVLQDRDIFGINGSFGTPEKMFSINFSKAKKKLEIALQWW